MRSVPKHISSKEQAETEFIQDYDDSADWGMLTTDTHYLFVKIE